MSKFIYSILFIALSVSNYSFAMKGGASNSRPKVKQQEQVVEETVPHEDDIKGRVEQLEDVVDRLITTTNRTFKNQSKGIRTLGERLDSLEEENENANN